MRINLKTTPSQMCIPFNYQPKLVGTLHMEKPRDFDPFGHAGFAHLWLQYD